MGRTKESEEIRGKFIKELRQEGFELHPVSEKLPLLSKNAEIHITDHKKDRPQLIFFIKVSSKPKNGFWGLKKSFFNLFYDFLKEKNLKNYIIFLDGPRRGYVLRGSEFDELRCSLYVDTKGEYKILKKNLDDKGGFRFMGINGLLKMLEVV